MVRQSLRCHRSFKSRALAFALISSYYYQALAFNPSRAITSSRYVQRTAHHRLLAGLDKGSNIEHESNVHSNAYIGADSITRRRLVFSLLASSSLLPPSAQAAINTQPTQSATTSSNTISSSSSETRVIRPPLDKRQYETYTLPNGLKVLLCSDPTSTAAAVGMNVHVGACSDPVEIPGLAHFCEHMLFLGTEKYPDEDSFAKFLSANGGINNAFTDSEKTVYYFEMDASISSRFSSALSRFGSFFSCPLFTPSATGRELNAIDSENSKNLQSDVFRLYELEKDRVNSQHPYAKFFTGNKETLETDTKKKGIDLRQKLVEFYNQYYSANQMCLAIVAPQPINELKKYVVDGFGDIINSGVHPPEDAWAFKVPPYAEGKSLVPAVKTIMEIVPIQELRQVTVTWPVVFNSKEEREEFRLNKPDYFVASLLGHEGVGSLLSYLKQKGWANALGASDNADLSDFVTFEVTVELTSKGLAAVDDVCEAIFSYVKMLRDLPAPDYIFDENLQLDELEWRYTTKGQPGQYVQSIVTAMDNKFPPSLYIAGPRRLALRETSDTLLSSDAPRTKFQSTEQREIIKASCRDLLSRLTVQNSFLTVFSKSFEGKTDQVEKWYGTEYNIRPIPVSTLMVWENCAPAKSLGMAYPRENVFIPSERGLRVNKPVKNENNPKALTFEEKMRPIRPPSVIRDDGNEGRWTVYFKEDDRFGQPKAFMIFQLLTDALYQSPTQAALAMLYQNSAADNLNEYTYGARLAGLTYDFQVLPRGARLTFGGYNDKLEDFASYVTSKLARDLDDVLPASEDEFERYRDSLLRALSAFNVKQPYAHAIYYAGLTQQPRNFQYSNDELVQAMKTTTLTQLKDYVRNLWAKGKGECLIQGNYNKQEALEIVETIDKTLSFKTIPADKYPKRLKALPLPITTPAQKPLRLNISEPNPSNNNAASQVTLQCLDTSEKSHVLIEIISAIIEEPLFNELRTNQQLGYIVSSGVKAIDQSRTLSVIVQSNSATAEELTASILQFLDDVSEKLIKPLSSVDIELYVKGLTDSRLEPDKRLAIEVTRNWSEIASGRFQYDRLQAEVGALLSITKADIEDFWQNLYVKERRMLVVQVVPKSGPVSTKEPSLGGEYKGGTPVAALGLKDIPKLREYGEEKRSEMK